MSLAMSLLADNISRATCVYTFSMLPVVSYSRVCVCLGSSVKGATMWGIFGPLKVFNRSIGGKPIAWSITMTASLLGH